MALVGFKTWWEEDFLVIEHRGGAKCLVCHRIFTHPKQFNIKRHYTRYHAIDYNQFIHEERIREIKVLKEQALQEEEEEDISDEVSYFTICGSFYPIFALGFKVLSGVYNNLKTVGILSSNMNNTISLLSMQKIIFEAQLLIFNLLNAVPIFGLIRKSIMQCWVILLRSTIKRAITPILLCFTNFFRLLIIVLRFIIVIHCFDCRKILPLGVQKDLNPHIRSRWR